MVYLIILISLCRKICYITARFLFEILLIACTRETPPFPTRDVPIVKKPFLLSEREDLHYRDKILLEKLLPTD